MATLDLRGTKNHRYKIEVVYKNGKKETIEDVDMKPAPFSGENNMYYYYKDKKQKAIRDYLTIDLFIVWED